MALLHLDLRRRHSLQAWSAKPRGMSRSPKAAPRLRLRLKSGVPGAAPAPAPAPDPKPELPSERLASAEDELSSMVIEMCSRVRGQCAVVGRRARRRGMRGMEMGTGLTRFCGNRGSCWLARTHDVLRRQGLSEWPALAARVEAARPPRYTLTGHRPLAAVYSADMDPPMACARQSVVKSVEGKPWGNSGTPTPEPPPLGCLRCPPCRPAALPPCLNWRQVKRPGRPWGTSARAGRKE